MHMKAESTFPLDCSFFCFWDGAVGSFVKLTNCQYADLYVCCAMACLKQSLMSRAKGALLQDAHSSLLAVMLARHNGFSFWPC